MHHTEASLILSGPAADRSWRHPTLSCRQLEQATALGIFQSFTMPGDECRQIRINSLEAKFIN